MREFINAAAGIIGAIVSYVFGGVDAFLIVLVIMSALDYITGVMCAYKYKELSSKAGFKGLFKKVGMLCVVSCAALLGKVGAGEILRDAVCTFYIANEALSLLENAAKLGLALPERLKNALSALKKDEEIK